jgi:hypothetical protein
VIEAGQRIWYVRRGTVLCELDGAVAEHDEPEVGDVHTGVLEDLKDLPDEASERTLAKTMIYIAKAIDRGEVSDRDVAPLLKELRQMLVQLKDQFPPEPEDDETEKKRKRRERLLMMDGELD